MSLSLPRVGDHSPPLCREQSLARSRGTPWRAFAGSGFGVFTRAAFGSFLLLTSVYCLLTWVPFSYFGFIHNPLLSWLPLFVHWHGMLYALVLTLVAITLIPDLRRPQTRAGVLGFLVLNGSAALYLWTRGVLGKLDSSLEAYLWSMLSLFPLLWLAVLDLVSCRASSLYAPRRSLNIAKTALAGVMISVAFCLVSALRARAFGFFAVRALGASLCFHLMIFGVLGLALGAIHWFSSRRAHPGLTERVLTSAMAAVLLMQFLRTIVLPTISFTGWLANIFAAFVSGTVVLFIVATAARMRIAGPTALERNLPGWAWAVAGLGLLCAAYAIPSLLARTDWDFVMQRSAVILVWVLALEMVRWSGLKSYGKEVFPILVLVLGFAGFGFARQARLALYNPNPAPEWRDALDDFAGFDISFKTAYDILSRPVDNQVYREFYSFLQQHTNLDRSVQVASADVQLVSNLQPTSGVKPNIFIFVLDSWRRDMSSAYDPGVDYTPEIGRFAGDSFVFRNAYTRYGGTALSEPAIWTGAMQLHKQYIEPFYPMNNLQKLVEIDGYHSYISVDPIVRMMLRPSSSITELETGTQEWSDLDFVPTLKELQAKLDARTDREKPIFAYTQPQNVHTITLERSKIKGGRKAVSMYELRRMDAAFGEFVQFLRQRRLYDSSIIILTADHGDCYGEYGRWGHSDFLFPQVIRIPLIVHLPSRLRQQFVSDQNQLAFTTDITPSLYYLLGHRPIRNSELLGRPLFTQSLEEQSAYLHSQYLIVSSYAPVYAVLSGNGQSLFIADAVNTRSYFYNLKEDPTGTHNHVSIQLENENQALIRRDVEMIDDLYGWHPAEKH